jgi:aryl-alcohol dehydrogenase-like predicted oxidoreductase
LASGLLTGKYEPGKPLPEGARLTGSKRLADRYLSEANWGKVERLMEFCHAHGHSLLELAFSWLLARPMVASVIAGATKPEQVEQNVKAADWQLTSQEIAEVDAITG